MLFIASVSFVKAQSSDAIIGEYHLPNAIDVEVYAQNGTYCAKIIRLNGFNDGQEKDINNPKKANREKLLLGKVIVENLVFNTENKQWDGGTIYAPEKGLSLEFKITECRKDEIEVVASKYLFWRTLIWRKL